MIRFLVIANLLLLPATVWAATYADLNREQLEKECIYRQHILRHAYYLAANEFPEDRDAAEYVAERSSIPVEWTKPGFQAYYLRKHYREARYGYDHLVVYAQRKGVEFVAQCMELPKAFFGPETTPILDFEVAPSDDDAWDRGVKQHSEAR